MHEIHAHHRESLAHEQRHEPRLAVFWPATLVADELTRSCTVLEVSPAGALLGNAGELRPGQRLRLRVRYLERYCAIELEARVAWAAAARGLAGVCFAPACKEARDALRDAMFVAVRRYQHKRDGHVLLAGLSAADAERVTWAARPRGLTAVRATTPLEAVHRLLRDPLAAAVVAAPRVGQVSGRALLALAGEERPQVPRFLLGDDAGAAGEGSVAFRCLSRSADAADLDDAFAALS